MTPLEKQLLERFLQQLTAAQAGQKDPEADASIRGACARQPEAAYLLVQRAIQLEQAFEAARMEAQRLQTELDQARSGSPKSFLGDSYAWGSQAQAPASVKQPATSSGRQPIPGVSSMNAAAPPVAAAVPARAAPGPWGGGSLLGTMATTAAGVVAGSFLYQGIQSMMNKDNASASTEGTHSAQNETPPHDSPEEIAQDNAADYSGDSFADAGGDSGDFS
ncbi:MAG: DUF2076 family protein [Pseudomonadota bacterium]